MAQLFNACEYLLDRRLAAGDGDRLALTGPAGDLSVGPAPGALAALREHLSWLTRTSPPAACEGMIEAISRARGVPAECLVPGAGSSDLIYRALLRWLTPTS